MGGGKRPPVNRNKGGGKIINKHPRTCVPCWGYIILEKGGGERLEEEWVSRGGKNKNSGELRGLSISVFSERKNKKATRTSERIFKRGE